MKLKALHDVGVIYVWQKGYEQFGISRKGPEDASDQHCTIFYDKEQVKHPIFL